MKAFRFSLETVLKVRRQAEEIRQRELAEAQAQRDRCLQRLGALESDLRDLLTEQSRRREGRLDMNEEAWFLNRHRGLFTAVRAAKEELFLREEALDRAREKAVEAARERRVLEKLEERQYQEFLFKLNREEQGFLDDLAQRSVPSMALSAPSATAL